jgi:hypothetical protein
MKGDMNLDIEQLKYPLGKFVTPDTYPPEYFKQCIFEIEKFPNKLRPEVIKLSGEQLDTPYRPGGWTIRQVIHHCADSHFNAFIRFKLSLSEEVPQIKAYDEKHFAEMADSRFMRIEPSLHIIDGLHDRWAALLKAMEEKDFERKYYHPEHRKEFALKEALGMYAWHCRHHLAHIMNLKKEKGWI